MFSQLISQNQIVNAATLPVRDIEQIDPLFNRIFLPSVEKILAKDPTDLVLKGAQGTMEEIQSRAQKLYKLPWILAERATYQIFILNRKKIYDEENHYIDEFIGKCRELEQMINEIYNSDEGAIVDQNYNEFLQEYALKIPVFSSV